MKEYGIVLENVDLKEYNSYHIGGKARYLIKPNYNQVLPLINYLEKNNINWYILGKGTNVILPDANFNGAIIKLDLLNNIKINNALVYVESGVLLSKLVDYLVKEGFTNLAPLYGIPGTIGAAFIGNVGSFGTEFLEYLESVTLINEDKKIVTLTKKDFKYAYRQTEFKNKKVIVLNVVLKLIRNDKEEAQALMLANLQKRKETQPLDTYNAGSVFKNPPNLAAGKLIDEVGLKGFKVNDACISTKHANFIVNLARAKSSDIIDLIKIIKNKVKEEKGVELELEQIIVKWE